jgi:hypothetical protein
MAALNPKWADGLNRLIGYKGRKDLRGENELVEYTPEMLDELERCMDDPLYFAKKYFKIVHVDRGFIPYEPYLFQEKIIDTVHKNRFIIAKLPRQTGKCCFINTVVKVKNTITGEIYETTVGQLFTTARKIKNQNTRNQRVEISEFDRGNRFRLLHNMRVESDGPNEPYNQKSQNTTPKLQWTNSFPEILRSTISQSKGFCKSSVSTWGQIFSIFPEIYQGRYYPRNSEKGNQFQKTQWNKRNPNRLLVEESEWEYRTGTNDVGRETTNFLPQKTHNETRGRGGEDYLANPTRQVAEHPEFEITRRISLNQSKKKLEKWQKFQNGKRTCKHSSRALSHRNSIYNQEWYQSFLLRYSSRTIDNRIQWRLLARQPTKIFSRRYFIQQSNSSTDLGQRQNQNRISRKTWVQGDNNLGIRFQKQGTRNYKKGSRLSETVNRKFVASFNLENLEIWTDTGWQPVTQIHQTIPYTRWELKTPTKTLLCADTHIVFREDGSEVFVENLVNGDVIKTATGPEKVITVTKTNIEENMYDITVVSPDHRYYTNDILSHNTTTVGCYILWYILFNPDKSVAILANKASTAREILSRIQKAYEALPKFIQQGVKTWNKGSVELANGSKIIADATSGSAIRGRSISLLLIDEMAHIEPHIAEEFFTATYPTISSGAETKVILISTPKGLNLFYEIWMKSVKGQNEYKRIEVHWSEVPGRDEAWFQEQLRNTSEIQVAQEVLCQFLGSGGTLISGAKLSQLEAGSIEPIATKENGNMRIYERPKPGHTYAITCDCATGLGGDAQAMQVIDVTEFPFRQVAAFNDNKLYYMLFPMLIYNTARWYNDAFVLIEINDVGQSVSYILQVEIGYDNLIKVKPKGKQGQQISGGFQKMTQYGLKQTTATKRIGCNALKAMVETDKLLLVDFKTIEELKIFVESTDSFAADEGASNAHDDLSMALVCFGWLSDQQFFKDSVGNNIRQNLERQLREIEDIDFIPFGFITDGVNHTYETAEDDMLKAPATPWVS